MMVKRTPEALRHEVKGIYIFLLKYNYTVESIWTYTARSGKGKGYNLILVDPNGEDSLLFQLEAIDE